MAKKIKYIGNVPINKDSTPTFSVFNDTYSTTYFNGGVELTTNFSIAQTVSNSSSLITTQKNVSLTDLKIYNIEELNNFIKISNRLKLNIDKSDLSSHSVYGSLREKFRIAVNNILLKFPGGLFINDYISGVSYYTVYDYVYNDLDDTSTFRIPFNVVENPNFLNLYNNKLYTSRVLANFAVRYEDYTIVFSGANYGINSFTGFSSGNTSSLFFKIYGNPFGQFSSTTISEPFLIRPNDIEFNVFYDSLNELERYFLNKNSTTKYSFTFKIPELNENDELEFKNYTLNFPVRYDGYNLDFESITYSSFLNKLFEIGNLYDDYKSNLILRKFIPTALIDFDTTDGFKSESIFKIYGKEIDEIKMFFDSLMYINNTSYDKINNIPDTLIKNLARTLSWKAQNIINDKNLIESVFANDRSGDSNIETSLAEVDIELWRRLVINTSFFLKSKGTRTAIETIFSFIGAPEGLISLTEHVYVVEAPISQKFSSATPFQIEEGIVIKPPYDEDGYPIAPTAVENTFNYFQAKGNEDVGQYYINLYRDLGFNVTKTIDNKKSWVYYESASTHSSIDRNTSYNINDSRLLINTKEIDVGIDIARAIEYDVYQFNKTYNYPVTNSGRPSPYPQRDSNIFEVTGLTFSQYIDDVYSKFINAQNRKVSDSAIGSYYPSLTKLYYDYLESPLSINKKRYKDLYEFVDSIDAIFSVFIKQFVPATSIFDGIIKIRNTEFTPQKYVYKQGIDDGSEFSTNLVGQQTEQQEQEIKQNLLVIDTEFFDTYEDTINIATISTEVKTSDNGNIDTPTYTKVFDNKLLQSTWDGRICYGETPTFDLTGSTKLALSSLTNNSIYEKSSQTGHTVSFNFTSATETLTAATTEFYFTVHKYDNSINVNSFLDTPIYTFSAISTSFTTSTTISALISDSLLACDTEYIIKPYFKYQFCPPQGEIFSAKSPYTMYEEFIYSGYMKNYSNSPIFFDYTKFVIPSSETISSLIPKSAYTNEFGNYNKKSDYYFVSNCSPDEPVISTPVVTETEGLIVETINVNSIEFTNFQLQHEPIGDIIVAVNGITLLNNLEYTIDNTITIPSIRNRSFVLTQRLTSEHNDVLTVSYFKNPNSAYRLIKEDFQYTGSTNITYNGTTGKYEIDLSYSRVQNSDMIVYLEGTLLAENQDYFVSVFNTNKIVLNLAITDPTLISVSYFTSFGAGGGTIEATGPSYDVNWSIVGPISNNVTGRFIHQFYEITNTGLTGTTTYSAITDYQYNTTNFTKTFYWPDTSLSFGSTYYYRIASEKTFKTINYIDLNSVKYSNTYEIIIPN